MRVVGLNYLGVPPVADDRNICLSVARVVICCTRRSRKTPQEKPDDDGCQEKEKRKKAEIFMQMCFSGCDDLFNLGRSVCVAFGAEL